MGVIRRVWPFEAVLAVEHLVRLEAVDRRHRFRAAMSDRALWAHITQIDWRCVVLFGYSEAGGLRALAELAADRPLRPRTAEGALSVEPAWRGHGLGHALLQRLVRAAAARGIATLELSTELGNTAMRRLALQYGGRVTQDAGELEILIPVPKAGPSTVWREAWEDSCALAVSLAPGSLVPRPWGTGGR